MQDHHQTAKQALKEHKADYKKPSSFKVTHRLDSVNDLAKLKDDYDLFIHDRDCYLTGYHAPEREPIFEDVLQEIAPKSELVSNSNYNEFLKIGEIFSDLFPVSKAVKFTESGDTSYLLRIVDNELHILRYNSDTNEFIDETSILKGNNEKLLDDISYNYKKPDPHILDLVINQNIQEGRIPEDPRVLMGGDRYLTDIVAGNLAGVDTALATPFKPFSDKLVLIAVRYLYDLPKGNRMSKLAERNVINFLNK